MDQPVEPVPKQGIPDRFNTYTLVSLDDAASICNASDVFPTSLRLCFKIQDASFSYQHDPPEKTCPDSGLFTEIRRGVDDCKVERKGENRDYDGGPAYAEVRKKGGRY